MDQLTQGLIWLYYIQLNIKMMNSYKCDTDVILSLRKIEYKDWRKASLEFEFWFN